VESIERIPLYNGDVKAADGIPQRVAALKRAITIAGGVLLSTPEYNNSMAGVLKNAIEWLSHRHLTSRPSSAESPSLGCAPVPEASE
jgi:NAD(P)H-dependent FMN reductase